MKRALAFLVFLSACGGPSSPNPTALLMAPSTGQLGDALAFDGTQSQRAARYSWDFGDGSRAGGEKVAHIFSNAGTFTITLTVAASGGKTASESAQVTITAPSPAPMIPVVGVVNDPSGAPLAGVTATTDGVTATSDAQGNLTMLVTAAAHSLQLQLSGYSTQAQPLDLTGALSGYFTATMQMRQPSQPLDANKGGTLIGPDGSSVTLPSGALVDASGQPVSGMVNVTLTPVNVESAGVQRAFPGRNDGINPDATTSPIASYGAVEYALEDTNGGRLQLAPGRTAKIHIPIYATTNLDGSAVAVGDTIALWSLDEASGEWIGEGQGSVVAVPGSSALALEAEVSHFTWWNGDYPIANPQQIGIVCQCQMDEEICAMFGKNAFTCHIDGAPNQNPPPAADSVAAPAYWRARDIVGQSTIIVPGNYALTLGGWAMDGSLRGTAPAFVAPGQSLLVTIPIAPNKMLMAQPDQAVTLPYQELVENHPAFTTLRYDVHLDGGALSAAFQSVIGTSAGLRLLDESGNQLASALADSQSGALSYAVSGPTDLVVELVLLSPMSQGQLTLRAGTITDENDTVPFTVPVSLGAGDEHRYHFTAAANDSLDVKWDSGGSAAIGVLSVNAPDGTELFSNDHLDTSFDWPLATFAGSYVITIQGINDVTGTLHVLRPTVSGSDGGSPTDASFAPDGGAPLDASVDMTPMAQPITLPFVVNSTMYTSQVYQFTAAAGTGIMIKAAGPGTVQVSEAGGTVVGSMAMGSGHYQPFYLQTGGSYLVEVASATPWGLDVEPVTTVTPVTQRSAIDFTLANTTPTTAGFTLNANAGDPLLLSFIGTADGCSVTNGGIYDNVAFNGSYYASPNLETVATSGTQFAVVWEPSVSSCGSAFEFSMRVPIAVTPGTPTAPFTEGGSASIQEAVSFNAPAGTVYCGKVTSSQSAGTIAFSTFNATMGTDLEQVFTGQYADSFGPLTANASGNQVVLIDPQCGVSPCQLTTDTQIWLYEIPSPPPSVSDPSMTTTTTLRPGEQKWYSFVSDPVTAGNWAFGKTKLSLTYKTNDTSCNGSACNGKAILYQDLNNGKAFTQTQQSIESYAGSFGGTNNTSAGLATIPSPAPTTWYVQLVPDPRHFAPYPTPAPYSFSASFFVTPQ